MEALIVFAIVLFGFFSLVQINTQKPLAMAVVGLLQALMISLLIMAIHFRIYESTMAQL